MVDAEKIMAGAEKMMKQIMNLTLADVEKMDQEMLKKGSERETTLLTNVFTKFTTESTDEDKSNGFVSICAQKLEN